MHLDRRNFIWKSSLLTISLYVSRSVVFHTLNFNNSKNLEETITQKLKRAADLRKSLGETENPQTSVMRIASSAQNNSTSLEEIKAIYQEIIDLDPSEIRAYDGMRKTILQEKYKELEVFTFFLNAYSMYSTDLNIKERLAKEYLRLSIGNKKFRDEVSNPDSLLDVCKQMFIELKNEKPYSYQYEIQYLRIVKLLINRAGEIDARDNPALRKLRNLNRLAYKNRYENLSSTLVKKKLDNLLVTNSSRKNSKNVRDVYKIYINKLLSENEIDIAVSEISNLIHFDRKDCDSLSIARTVCNKYKYYKELEKIERENDSKKNTLWSKAALFDVLLRKYNLNKDAKVAEMKEIINSALKLSKTPTESFEIKSREIKLALAQNNASNSLKLLLQLSDEIYKITSAHWIDRFNMLCVNYYKKIGNNINAIKVINIALKENTEPLNDTLLIKIELVNKNRETQNGIHNKRLSYQRDQLLN